MGLDVAAMRASIRRHGLIPTLQRSLLSRARRIVDFEICRVECDSGEPFAWPDAVGYETRMVGEAEFHEYLCDELRGADYRWAFARGDVCAASFRSGELVGYAFFSSLPTRVRDGIAFMFPPNYVYSYASTTARSHRGRRLSRDFWKTARRYRVSVEGRDPKSIWYVDVGNLESRAAIKAMGLENTFIGYTAYVRIGRRFQIFNSAGCRRTGAGFISTS